VHTSLHSSIPNLTPPKDVFKVRGRQVSPNELESVLLGHPQITDVAVVGVPALWPATGDMPRAYVIRKSPPLSGTSQNGSSPLLSEADVKEWIVQRLARYKALDGGVEFVESIPRTSSGKILRRLLKIKEQVAG
jgi:acyl-CoA synthetase (AMP-forming)/AMP-acid ligase II